jgi:MerR family transcriptional regulator, copper efflux regulator
MSTRSLHVIDAIPTDRDRGSAKRTWAASQVGNREGAEKKSGEAQMRVGDLAERSGKTVRAIHLYEELGLLSPSTRSAGGYRMYGEDALLRIRLIQTLQDLGLSLPEIRDALASWLSDKRAKTTTAKMHAFFKEKIAAITEQMERLRRLERELHASVAYLERCGDVCEPAREIESCGVCDLNHFSCTLHAGEDAVPPLVRGFRDHEPRKSEPRSALAKQDEVLLEPKNSTNVRESTNTRPLSRSRSSKTRPLQKVAATNRSS